MKCTVRRKKIKILLKIPHDERIARLYSKGIPFIFELPEWKEKFIGLFETIKKELGDL